MKSQFHYGMIQMEKWDSVRQSVWDVSIPLWYDSNSVRQSVWDSVEASQFHYGMIQIQ